MSTTEPGWHRVERRAGPYHLGRARWAVGYKGQGSGREGPLASAGLASCGPARPPVRRAAELRLNLVRSHGC